MHAVRLFLQRQHWESRSPTVHPQCFEGAGDGAQIRSNLWACGSLGTLRYGHGDPLLVFAGVVKFTRWLGVIPLWSTSGPSDLETRTGGALGAHWSKHNGNETEPIGSNQH